MLTQQLGDRLADEGYRGFFEVDYLADVDTGELYLGEINPRISGVTSMTNVTAGAYADMPLFLFHLLEYLDVDYEIDVDDINRRWAQASSVDVWSQLILKQTRRRRSSCSPTAPQTGIWRLDDETGGDRVRAAGATTGTACTTSPRRSTCACSAPATTATRAPTSACSSRARGMQTEDNELTERARTWIDGDPRAVRRHGAAGRRRAAAPRRARVQVRVGGEGGDAA